MLVSKSMRETDRADTLVLAEPTESLFEAFAEMSMDYRSAGESRYQHEDGWNLPRYLEYVNRLRDNSLGIDLPPTRSPQTTFWLMKSTTTIFGVSRLRLQLNDDLRIEGGNIGYDVPPSWRRKGYGTELLRQTLVKARQLGLERVLITCNKENEGSRKIIEANGGVLASEGISPKYGKPILRFWIG
jgi:predicted acetyltransferase